MSLYDSHYKLFNYYYLGSPSCSTLFHGFTILRKHKRKPSFFKILIHDFYTRLQIPPAFIREFGKDDVPKKTTLETYNGKSWEVGVEKLGNKFYFNKGRDKFVEVNSLENGDFLVLKYFADYSKFRVKGYGKTCFEKQLNVVIGDQRCSKPLNDNKEDQRYEQEGRKRKRRNEEEVEDDDDVIKDGESKAFKSNVIKLHTHDYDDEEEDLGGTQKRKEETVVEFQRNEEYGRMPADYHNHIEFKYDNPFFQVQLKLSNVNSYLYISKGFYEKHMKENKRMKLEVYERTWNMEIYVFKHERGTKRTKEARVTQGWRRLVKEHHLEMGDICIFEMIKNYDSDLSVFHVHVYKWNHNEAEFSQMT